MSGRGEAAILEIHNHRRDVVDNVALLFVDPFIPGIARQLLCRDIRLFFIFK